MSLSQTCWSFDCAGKAPPTSSIRLRKGKRWRFSSGGPSRAAVVSVFEQRSMARSMAPRSFGVIRLTCGLSLPARRSATSWAVVRMFRRSWLILVTAVPSAARRVFCCRAVRSLACMSASSCWATPISSVRVLAGNGRDRSSGFSRNAVVFSVIRRIGSTGGHCRVR